MNEVEPRRYPAERRGQRLPVFLVVAVFACFAAACSADEDEAEAMSGPEMGSDASDARSNDSDASTVDTGGLDVEPDGSSEDASDGAASGEDSHELPETFQPTEQDFRCLTDWPRVRGFHLTNLLGLEAEAIAVAEAGMSEPFPPGTVVQLIPQEAMVKRLPGFAPELGDWEFFRLSADGADTVIDERGGAEVENVAGSCAGCHAAASERDFICEQDGTCAAAALPREIIDSLVANDSRCD